ncbi:hypothetical protein [Piscinibacter koreensis]|uniref:Uncharacterized protein n=1 Tax=Piscinibacter koreensis TaxID=2742824 RepID=A0A7Y6NKX5_9BURK|nr:hypothetical protein [Schlegelella koreensis]NUZ05004.1 hypothetical protein [Schlegelella koreensis]
MPPTDTAAAPRAISADSFAGMFQAVDGLRNGRAVVALMGCWVAAVLVGALLSMLAVVIGGLAALLSAVGFIVVAGTGVNAAGSLQMDQARGLAPRSLADALAHGLACVPRMIVLGLVLLAVAIAVFILIAIALFVCKIPYLGALLYVVVFPVSVLLAGVTLTALFFGWLLALPAIWDGAPIARAIAQTLAIVRSRFVEALLLLFVVGLLCLAVALILFSVIGSGIVPTVAMSVPIFGMDAMVGSAFMGDLMQGVGAGRAAAAGIGLMVLWAIAFAVIAQVYLQGLNRVYLRVTHGLDVESAEAALQQTVNSARERGAGIADKARAAAAAARERAAQASAGTSAGDVPDRSATPAGAVERPAMFADSTPLQQPAADRSTASDEAAAAERSRADDRSATTDEPGATARPQAADPVAPGTRPAAVDSSASADRPAARRVPTETPPDRASGLIARAAGAALGARSLGDGGDAAGRRAFAAGAAARTGGSIDSAPATGVSRAAGAAGAAGSAGAAGAAGATGSDDPGYDAGTAASLRAGRDSREPDFRPTQPFDDAFETTLPPSIDDEPPAPQPFATRLQPSAALGGASTNDATPAPGSGSAAGAEPPMAPAAEPASAADTFVPFTRPDPTLEAASPAAEAPPAGGARGSPAAPVTRELEFDLPRESASAGAATVECPRCKATCAAGDAFCEACGQRLR